MSPEITTNPVRNPLRSVRRVHQPFEERVRGARLQPGNAYAALIAGKTAAHIGRLGDAEDWYRLAAIYEPNGAEVLAESAAFLSKVGRVERARELLNVFEALQSTNLGAWESARDAYQTLGELEMVDRANLCSIYYRVAEGVLEPRGIEELLTEAEHVCGE